MAVDYESYNTPTLWTPDNARDMFEQAFIDAGWLPVGGWFDSFDTGTFRHGILEVEHDATKTYGTTYYWFIFSTERVYVHFCTGWNPVTHLPPDTGNSLDHCREESPPLNNNTSRHHRMMSPQDNVTLQLVRYTSGVDPTFTWFVLKNGTTELRFFLHLGTPNATFCDLDTSCYHGLYYFKIRSSSSARQGATAYFESTPIWIRRHFQGGASIDGSSSSLLEDGRVADFPGSSGSSTANLANTGSRVSIAYFWPAYSSAGSGGNPSIESVSSSTSSSSGGIAVRMPIYNGLTNPATSFESPIFNGIPYSMYSPQLIPADFGLAATYNNNTIQTFDRYILDAGVNEWEVLEVNNQSRDSLALEPTVMLLARAI